ncbi:unnamed protein product [Darwinula stevensoni]|uniref:AIG1-type G domain-containing protein n=1 Tax=Darwinula stevensoni TaxID=69355 RepID=A0A7R9AC68_9CRUS|nr:unnamed protein product [Darwinula stevensoni]CAG0899730.1 unnamed protein product [Darwinula stevensoni]
MSGKSKLVDVLGNYGMGVSFRDPYRFQVKEDGPTEKITSHTFFTRDERRFPRPVTLIDTPGLQKGNPKDDKKLMEDIRAFIQHHHQQGIHAVIYVAPNSQGRLTAEQKIVLGNMANILGDKTEKISYLFCTFADGKSLPVLKSVKEAGLKYQKHFAVNSSSYFSVVEEEDGSSIDDDEGKSKEVGGESMNELLWKLTTDSIEDFVMGIQKNQPIQTQEILSSGEENEEKKNGKSRRSSEEVEKVPLITGGRFPQPAGEDPDPSIGQRSFCGRIRRSFKRLVLRCLPKPENKGDNFQ